jgi:hypothetical protein
VELSGCWGTAAAICQCLWRYLLIEMRRGCVVSQDCCRLYCCAQGVVGTSY